MTGVELQDLIFYLNQTITSEIIKTFDDRDSDEHLQNLVFDIAVQYLANPHILEKSQQQHVTLTNLLQVCDSLTAHSANMRGLF